MIRQLSFFLLALLMTKNVLAQETSPLKKEISVIWYQPEVDDSEKPLRTRIILSGTTLPGAEISVSSDVIPLLTVQDQVKYIARQNILVEKKVVADENGFFVFPLDLPSLLVQLPIVVAHEDEKKLYQLSLGVQPSDVTLTNLGALGKAHLLRPKFNLWFGTGFNFLRYSQSSEDIGSDLTFDTFKGPSFYAKGDYWLSETWQLAATVKSSPGETTSSESITVNNGNYNWLIFGAEGLKFPSKWRYLVYKNWHSQLGYRFGIQHHIVPFLARTGDDATTAEIKTNSVTMLTGGVHYSIHPSSKLDFEIFMRYQHPLSTGDVFDISPKFAFDGSVGAVYKWSRRYKVGVYWYGQWHSYSFTHLDAFTNQEINGDQSLFFSNVEIRAGISF